ncbi:RNI-like superfamily protein [Artemisia annua]|uniref:RNI-like superfamily protein n=1 Tax=Artemisia annua TaxID=35608 RepID=A0A2U1PU74_ARTAN|nr:RNI-like superfamily protein [Artemisia annua]
MDNKYTLRDLRAIAKQRKIKGFMGSWFKLVISFHLLSEHVEVTRTSTSKLKKQHEMKQTTRSWLDLPSDVMANVLSRVGVIEILWNVQIVCTKWHKICKDPYVWRVIYIDNDFYYHRRPYTWPSYLPNSASSWKATVETLLAAALKKFSLLEELSLYPGTLHREDIEALGCYCPMLKTLKLNHCFGNFDGSNIVGDLVMAIVENLPELRHLELTWHLVSDSMLQAILDGCRHLQVLDLQMFQPVVLKGELRKRCSEQIKSLKLPTDPLKTSPHSDDDATVDLLS